MLAGAYPEAAAAATPGDEGVLLQLGKPADYFDFWIFLERKILMRTSENMIQQMVGGSDGAAPGLRERHVFSQALYGLVRLAKSEQMLEMRMDVQKATGTVAEAAGSRSQARALLRKIGGDARQGQFQFDQDHGAGQG